MLAARLRFLLADRDAWDARLNPMLVRCVRQELRSRGFVVVYLLLLLGAAAASLAIAYAAAGETHVDGLEDGRHGRWLFTLLVVAWVAVVVVWQAGATRRAVLAERHDETWDLVELTGMGPRRVVRGLLMASMVQSGVYTAGLAPFLAMAYLLRGVDVLAILEVLVLVPWLGAMASAWAVLFAAAVPMRQARGMMMGGFVPLLSAIVFLAAGTRGMSGLGGASLLGTLWNAGWGGVLVGALLLQGGMLLIWAPLVLAETLLSHRAEDRSSRPRGVVLIVAMAVVLWGAVGGCWEWVHGHAWWRFGSLSSVVLMALAGITGFLGGTEDAALTVRQARALAERPAWWRGLMAPGDRRGLRLAAILAVLALGGAVVLGLSATDGEGLVLLQAEGYVVIYALAIFLLGDAWLRGPGAAAMPTPLARRGALLGALAVVSVVPLLGKLTPWPVVADVAQFLSPPLAVAHLAMGEADAVARLLVALMGVPLLAWFVVRVWPRAIVTRQVVADAAAAHPRG